VAKPLVSFVVPVFNSEKDIARCLLSIRRLQLPDKEYEVIIMDNGSTDRTHQIMHELGFNFYILPEVSVGALRNRGAALAQGDYIAFVDSDVELTPLWLQNGLAGFTDPKVVACGCFPGVPNDSTWVQYTWDLHQRGRQRRAKSTPVSWLSSMNLLVRREDFLMVSGFNEDLKTAEDVDLCYRLGKRGTILHHSAMEAIHWGEARDLKKFWRKEVWRGLGSLKGALSHGLRWDELPSLGYPIYVIGVILLFCLGACIDLWRQQLLTVPLCLILLFAPALLLALNTARLTKCPEAVAGLFLLYLVYGLARAYAMVKA
jgi:glycosyltransferase involved in cell wall biosynthesis